MTILTNDDRLLQALVHGTGPETLAQYGQGSWEIWAGGDELGAYFHGPWENDDRNVYDMDPRVDPHTTFVALVRHDGENWTLVRSACSEEEVKSEEDAVA